MGHWGTKVYDSSLVNAWFTDGSASVTNGVTRWKAAAYRPGDGMVITGQGKDKSSQHAESKVPPCLYATFPLCEHQLMDIQADFFSIAIGKIAAVIRVCRTQVIEKECGYACDSDCDKNQDPDPENIINIDMHPIEKLCKSQQFNEACTSLWFDHPQERTQTGENLNENDLTRDTCGQNGDVIHKEVKQFVGQLCEEAFSNSSDLVNHENSHIGKKRDNCRQPGKTFKYGKCFEKHKLAVTIEKPYACEHCGKDFSERSSCTRHERVHTAEKLFTCKDFRKTFSYHSHLKSHELIHTGEKPYACKYYGKAFNWHSHLKSHEWIYTEEKPYACKHCGKLLPS
ncbi:hypothetical protein STEG23_017489 [Scotinomys teguina]